jgi:hypothetical protein
MSRCLLPLAKVEMTPESPMKIDDFDSAIPRFESWHPSQRALKTQKFYRTLGLRRLSAGDSAVSFVDAAR